MNLFREENVVDFHGGVKLEADFIVLFVMFYRCIVLLFFLGLGLELDGKF